MKREDLFSYIENRIEENSNLDYKAAASIGRDDKKKNEITKDVSAFANADGGRIIYGIKEFNDTEKRNLPEALDPIDQREFSKEWLEHIISQIKPKIDGILISPVHVGTNEWDYCYVVDIPQGETAHQAKDLRYYKRRNFEILAMDDYEIRDVMNRQKNPVIHAEVRVSLGGYVNGTANSPRVALRLTNKSKVIASHYCAVMKFPLKIRNSLILIKNSKMASDGDACYIVTFSNANGGLPLFPDARVTYNEEIVIAKEIKPFPENLLKDIQITLYADEMPKIELTKNLDAAIKGWT
jgi:hypothetical protein